MCSINYYSTQAMWPSWKINSYKWPHSTRLHTFWQDRMHLRQRYMLQGGHSEFKTTCQIVNISDPDNFVGEQFCKWFSQTINARWIVFGRVGMKMLLYYIEKNLCIARVLVDLGWTKFPLSWRQRYGQKKSVNNNNINNNNNIWT